jgi:hypothetical protein
MVSAERLAQLIWRALPSLLEAMQRLLHRRFPWPESRDLKSTSAKKEMDNCDRVIDSGRPMGASTAEEQ